MATGDQHTCIRCGVVRTIKQGRQVHHAVPGLQDGHRSARRAAPVDRGHAHTGEVRVMRPGTRRVLRVCLLVDLLAVAFWAGVLTGGGVTPVRVLALAGVCCVALAAAVNLRREGRS